MIIRKQQIKTNAEEVSLQVSYSLPDVKKAMQRFFSLLSHGNNVFAASTPLSELDILHFLRQEVFAHFPLKYQEQLAAWMFAMAVKYKFIFSSEDPTEEKKVYFLSEKLKSRIGRPPLSEEDWD